MRLPLPAWSLLAVFGSAMGAVVVAPTAAQEPAPGTEAPATQAAPARHELIVPEGFEVIEANGRRALVTADDAAWVRQVLEQVEPPAPPTTMPADVVERALERRDRVIDGLATDLGTQDRQPVVAMYDHVLLPALQRMETLNPPLIYLAAESDHVKALLKAGWSDPRFRYNRAADEIMINQRLNITSDRAMDDTLVPVLRDSGEPPEQRQARLREAVELTEAGVLREMSRQAQLRVQFEIIRFVEAWLVERFEYKSDQVWFRLGVSAVLGTRYGSMITGTQEMEYLVPLVADPPNPRVRAASIDLLAPTQPSSLRPQYVTPYMDALRRRSIAAVYDWLKEAPAGALPGVIAAIDTRQPADGEALAELIKSETGADIAANLRPLQ